MDKRINYALKYKYRNSCSLSMYFKEYNIGVQYIEYVLLCLVGANRDPPNKHVCSDHMTAVKVIFVAVLRCYRHCCPAYYYVSKMKYYFKCFFFI